MRILLLEDHNFFGDEVAEYLHDDLHYEVCYAHNYDQAIDLINQYDHFDYSFIDVLLQNGRTGIDVVSNYEKQLGKIMFITGCADTPTLDRIKKYASASKLFEIWPKIQCFLKGEKVSITS